jgi:hypothetical protein
VQVNGNVSKVTACRLGPKTRPRGRTPSPRTGRSHALGDTVSGRTIKPTERKNLGPWLTDPALICRWDVLVAARGDRISRVEFAHWPELEAWAVAHGKTLVVAERGGVYFPPRKGMREADMVAPAAWARKADWQQIAGSQLAGIYLVHD